MGKLLGVLLALSSLCCATYAQTKISLSTEPNCPKLISEIQRWQLQSSLELKVDGKLEHMPTLRSLSNITGSSFLPYLWASPTQAGSSYEVIKKRDDGFFFTQAVSIKHSLGLSELDLLKLKILGDGQTILGALGGDHPGQLALQEMDVSDSDSGALAPTASEALVLPLKRDFVRYAVQPGQPVLWLVDGTNRIFAVSNRGEDGLELILKLRFGGHELGDMGLTEFRITDLRFFKDSRSGLLEVKSDEGDFLIWFELQAEGETLQFVIDPSSKLSLPLETLSWDIHPTRDFIFILKDQNQVEILSLHPEGAWLQLDAQALEIGDYQAKNLHFYHDSVVQAEEAEEGGYRLKASGPYRLAIQADDGEGNVRLIWVRVGPDL